ncbi:uncharacterized protein BDV14DRAFT_182749 [Aspergillus stella-maris]|uniref:uncharacterized protein n=1 Tax=Aspergillus stella-maris TaxID=1810926 RepID=UPI003CCCD251
MSDPIPSAAPNEPSTSSTSAEDRKAAAALSSLNTTEVAASSGEPASTSIGKQPSSADQEALGKAMSRLEIAAGKSGGKVSSTAKGKDESGSGDVRKKVAAVKVAGEDVTLLVCFVLLPVLASASITLCVG